MVIAKVSALRTARIVKGLSQAALARRLGMSQPRFSEIESGKVKPAPKMKDKIARILGLPREILFSDDKDDD